MITKIANAYCNDILGTFDGVEIANFISNSQIKEFKAIEDAINRLMKI